MEDLAGVESAGRAADFTTGLILCLSEPPASGS